jgi:putative membrane protein
MRSHLRQVNPNRVERDALGFTLARLRRAATLSSNFPGDHAMRLRRTLLSLFAASLAAAGCRALRPIDPNAPSAEAVSETPPSGDTAAGVVPPPPIPTDPRRRDIGSVNDRTISAMLLASNNTDISYARLVPSRSERDDVRRFAQRMLTDHTGINALITELLTKRGWVPEENTASLDLRDESANRRDAMRNLSGFSFDSAYASNEISYHRRFLELIDQTMIPRARNGDLKTLLMNVRPAVAAHLAHAEQLWANVMTRK